MANIISRTQEVHYDAAIMVAVEGKGSWRHRRKNPRPSFHMPISVSISGDVTITRLKGGGFSIRCHDRKGPESTLYISADARVRMGARLTTVQGWWDICESVGTEPHKR